MAENIKPSGKVQEGTQRRAKTDLHSLAPFHVIDSLEVGPVRVEPRRLVAPYTVHAGGRSSSIDLVYSYEEDVFTPGRKTDQNLANMIAAQVALNYGLFCDRIVFRGVYDSADRRFLNNMADNTAREIYVKKFLEPNPFLRFKANGVPIVKARSYLHALLEYPDAVDASRIVPWSPLESRRDRIAVSSSGGKDSLLSYGLLDELGYEVHPIFINESGRHWYTALNAYRAFKSEVPGTGRVWTNSDRVFAWMLRHLPFIRSDFARVRSDEYPVRLWTVAVFLFGELPLLRKRSIGRFVVGDEHDTTDRRTYKGITHFNGLYDQSRYFDNALSRYYARKKWRLSQFSILRPLSELLIETILVNRFPKYFRHQISCHAAHTEGRRVLPCGRCEKCRRIVGMVMAVGGDPVDCGYTNKQVSECLSALAEKGVYQELAGAQQLMFLLERQGVLPSGRGSHRGKEHPEILKLRFDRERSPMDATPKEFREPLYRVFLEYATGAVRRSGNTWVEIDALNDPVADRPYIFERQRPSADSSVETAERSFLLSEMTWPEAQRRFQQVDIALLPVGAIEQHGPHLPLDTDAFDADYLAKSVAERCSFPQPVVLPTISYGVSYHHDDFPGTMSIDNGTLSQLVYDIGMSAAKNGITKLVIINGHGGNDPALHFAAQEINRYAHIFVAVDTGETSNVDIDAMTDTPNDVHAGEIETSTSLAVRPELVRIDRAEKFVPEFSSRYLDFTSKRGVSWYAFTQKISESGVLGDPTRASAEKGKKMWEAMIGHLVAFVEDLKQLTLDEIFQKRY